ncbi:unnamed protein product, partial [Discosporangium mesarthrocarpum]
TRFPSKEIAAVGEQLPPAVNGNMELGIGISSPRLKTVVSCRRLKGRRCTKPEDELCDGLWCPHELRYVDCLCELFFDGLLAGVREGEGASAFLADVLSCSRRRMGTKLGRNPPPFPRAPTRILSGEEERLLTNLLREAEDDFLECLDYVREWHRNGVGQKEIGNAPWSRCEDGVPTKSGGGSGSNSHAMGVYKYETVQEGEGKEVGVGEKESELRDVRVVTASRNEGGTRSSAAAAAAAAAVSCVPGVSSPRVLRAVAQLEGKSFVGAGSDVGASTSRGVLKEAELDYMRAVYELFAGGILGGVRPGTRLSGLMAVLLGRTLKSMRHHLHKHRQWVKVTRMPPPPNLPLNVETREELGGRLLRLEKAFLNNANTNCDHPNDE